MDGYPMSVADLLVDAAAGHWIISFMDGNAGYNQIFMAEEDITKTAFRSPCHVGLFEWIVMTFVGYFKHKQKNPQAHGYRCSFHQGVFQSIDFPQGT